MNTKTRTVVIIAEDREDVRITLQESFMDLGFEVFAVDGGDEAFEIFLREGAQLIISDIRMSKGNGIELLRKLRRHHKEKPEIKPPPIIVTTAIMDRGESYLRALGVAEIFIKPFELSEVIHAALKHLGRS